MKKGIFLSAIALLCLLASAMPAFADTHLLNGLPQNEYLTVLPQTTVTSSFTPGSKVTVSGAVGAPLQNIDNLTLYPKIWTPTWQYIGNLPGVKIGNLTKGSSSTFSFTYQLPTDAPLGVYKIDLSFLAGNPSIWPSYAQAYSFDVVKASSNGCGPTTATAISGMHVTLDESFQEATLNTNFWNPWPDMALINTGGLEAYTPNSFEMLPGGGLRIIAQKADFGSFTWTSGELTSFGSFSQAYGHFEMNAKLPKGNGMWPAFWMLPDNDTWPPEIDVMEVLGQDPNALYTTLHYNADNQSQALMTKTTDLSAECHVYAVDWKPNSLVWSLDGKEIFSVQGSQVPSQPMYLIANLGVGGSGSWAKPPDATTPTTDYMDIYSIRAYQYNDIAAPAPEPIVFGKTVLSSYTAKPGDVITLTSTAKLGALNLGLVTLDITTKGYNITYQFPEVLKNIGTPAENSVLPLSADIVVPSNAQPGVYNVAVQLNAYSKNLYPHVLTGALLTVEP